MAQDKPNVRRCGQIGDGDDDHVTLIDVLNEEERLQADADAVLGGSDEYNCTYPQGYLKRQALYACATCTPEGNAGICLACSYACHEGHDLYELYTKRLFKCDCGNEKFKGNQCQLYKEKKELNSRNRYDQNFRGLYCTCSRPYPDDDDPVEDEMIQCIMCEDWYHGRHLKAEVPDSSDYHEMICSGCMSKYSFLWAYHIQCSVTPVTKPDPDASREDAKLEVSSPVVGEVAGESAECDGVGKTEDGECPASPESRSEKRKAEHDNDEVCAAKKLKTEATQLSPGCTKSTEHDTSDDGEHVCLLKSLQQRVVDQPDTSVFLSEGWRSKLCRCPDCMDMYEDRNIGFLVDEGDTMQAYEERGQQAALDAASEAEADAAAFSSMNRVQQIEVVRGVMDLRTELNTFLQGFAREGKVVKESDIREFFQGIEQRRRERMQLPQHNCR